MCNNDFEYFDYVTNLISYKLARIDGVLNLTPEDRKDLEQEMLVHLLERWPQFDPERGTVKTFINCALNNRILQLIESRNTHKWGYEKWAVSLDEVIEGADGFTVKISDAVEHEECMLRAGRIRLSAIDECELRIDLERVISRLSPELRDLCERLTCQSVFEISQETGTPRHRLYSSMRKIRCIFVEAVTVKQKPTNYGE